MSGNTVSLGFARAIKQTDKELLVEIEEEGFPVPRSHLIPQSCISDYSEVWEAGQSGALVVARWWAEEEGLA
jgi:hypothetical protein